MRNQDWYDLGDKVQKIVQDAVNSRDFRQLNENITQTLNRTEDQLMAMGEEIAVKRKAFYDLA